MIWQFIINGLIKGLPYSLMAIGFALVYNTTRVFHIAAAGIYVFAAYLFWWYVVQCGFSLFFAAFLAIVLTMALSCFVEVCIYRPFRKKVHSPIMILIVSIGIMSILVNLIAMIFGNETKVLDSDILSTYALGSVIITTPQLCQIVVAVVAIVFFLIILNSTKFGLKLRALSADRVLFEILGYNRDVFYALVFLLSGMFIGLASCTVAYDVGMDPQIGMPMLINAMVAMIIGGVGRFDTCVIGGLLLGVLQSLTVYVFASNWQNAITFVILLLFLFLRPQGIAGYKQRIM